MKTIKKERDITWDIVRGIGILLVLVGHSGCPIILKNFIYLFHMGLFLFVSGLFITPPSTINITVFKFIRSKIKRLWIPFIMWGFSFVLLHNLLFHIGWNKDYYSISLIFKKIIGVIFFKEIEPQLVPIWFLKSLFFSIIGSYLICLIKYKAVRWCIVLLLYLFGWLCATTGHHLFFSIERECIVTSVIFLGYSFKKNTVVLKKYWIPCLLVLLVFLSFVHIDLAISKVGFCGAVPLSTFCGVSIIYVLSLKMKKKMPQMARAFSWLGRNSLDIMIVHYLGMQLFSQVLVWLDIVPISQLYEVPVPTSLIGSCYWICYTIMALMISILFIFTKNKVNKYLNNEIVTYNYANGRRG